MFESQSFPPLATDKKLPGSSLISDVVWNANLDVAGCSHCHWRFLIPRDASPASCPNCYQGSLAVLPEGLPDLPEPYSPELIVPFSVSGTSLTRAVHDFAAGIPFAPIDLNETALRERLLPVYLPVWLVDGLITANWQTEAGFNYEVVSHEETYNGDQNHWQSREIKEPRTRWESRVGQLNRSYQNVIAPAIDDARQIEENLGGFNMTSAQSFNPDCLVNDGRQACIRLPDHPPKEAWSETAAAFQKAAAAEVQQACSADRLRLFRWKAQYASLNWTLMLLPAYSASYLDDAGKPQPVHIHGQTGKIYGVRKASMRRARQTGLYLLLGGILLFLAALLLDSLFTANPVIAILSTYASILGIAGIIASPVPLLMVWDFNHRQALQKAQARA